MTETKSREKITVIDLPVSVLRSFEEHPYKVVDNEEMASLVDSIYNQGILTPITVRPLAKRLSSTKIPLIVFKNCEMVADVIPLRAERVCFRDCCTAPIADRSCISAQQKA